VTRESFIALVGNTILLLLLVYVYDLLNVFHWLSRTWIRQVIAGLAIGAIGIFVMVMPGRSWKALSSTRALSC
jgi:hypothetical protein